MQRVKLFFREVERAFLYVGLNEGAQVYGIMFCFTLYWLAWGNSWWGEGTIPSRWGCVLLGGSVLVLLLGWFAARSKMNIE